MYQHFVNHKFRPFIKKQNLFSLLKISGCMRLSRHLPGSARPHVRPGNATCQIRCLGMLTRGAASSNLASTSLERFIGLDYTCQCVPATNIPHWPQIGLLPAAHAETQDHGSETRNACLLHNKAYDLSLFNHRARKADIIPFRKSSVADSGPSAGPLRTRQHGGQALQRVKSG